MSSPLHPELLGLLGGCRHAPADDTPRLVLADWLEEHADVSGFPAADALARAELIRLQVELARPTLDTARTVQLRAAEARLLDAHSAAWLGDLPRLLEAARPATEQQSGYQPPSAPRQSWWFSRGLLCLSLAYGELRDPKLCGWFGTPLGAWTDTVTVDAVGFAELERLEVPDPLRDVLGLRFDLGAGHEAQPGALTGARARRVFKSAAFGLVRALTLSHLALEPDVLKLLAEAHVGGVRYLSVSAAVGAARAARLATVPFVNLSVLRVSRCGLDARAFAALVRGPHFTRLVQLDAYRNPFGSAGAVALAESPLAEGLRHVEFQNCAIGDRGGVALAESPLLARLYGPGLNLMMNPLGNGFAKALAATPNVANFTELVFRDGAVGDAGAKALAASPYLSNVTYLDLWSNRVGDAGAKALAASDALPNVRDLNLRDNRVTAKGAAALRAKYGDRAKV